MMKFVGMLKVFTVAATLCLAAPSMAVSQTYDAQISHIECWQEVVGVGRIVTYCHVVYTDGSVGAPFQLPQWA